MRNEQQIYQKETSPITLNSKIVKVSEISLRSRSINKQTITREGEKGEDYMKPFSRIVNPTEQIKAEDILY